MANKPLKTIKFPGLDDTYTVPQVDAALATSGAAADAKKTGDELSDLKQDLEGLDVYTLGLYPQMSVADTAVASFTDGADDIPVKALTVDITPVQDLHGQANPYPGGGGKNLLPMTVAGIKAANTNGTWSGNSLTLNGVTFTIQTDAGGNVTGIQVNGTPSANTTFIVAHYTGENLGFILNGCPSNGSDSTYRLTANSGGNDYGSGVNIGSGWNGYVSIYVYAQVSNIIFKPMIRLSSVSDATFAPYSNICPISGWTGANVSVFDVNVWDEEWEAGSISTSDGSLVPSEARIRSKNKIFVLPSATYYIYNGSTSASVYVFAYDANDNMLDYWVRSNQGQQFPAGTAYIRISPNDTYGTTYKNDISINYPSTETAYHAYKGNVYPISFPTEAGTVYGGTLDVTSGVLTVDRTIISKAWGEWGASGTLTNNTRKMLILSNKCATGASSSANKACNLTPYFGNYTTDTPHFYVESENVFVFLPNDTASDVVVQVVYPLLVPWTYQLTPTEVATILGQNNIFADTGDIAELTYRADLKAYIDAHVGS